MIGFKRVVFQPNLKYLHVVISFPCQPTWSCFDFKNMVERIPERARMPFTLILLQCPRFAVKSSTYPSGFGCIIYCSARENGQWVVKTPQPYSWMKLAALRANSHVRTRKLSNFDRRKSKHFNCFLCIHLGRVLLKTLRKGFLNERKCHLLEFCRNVHISQVTLLKSEIF